MPSRLLPQRRQSAQEGYIMMALTLAVALVLIGLAAGAPAISAELRRQREEELIHRGVQYTRAIRNYYHKFGTYPSSLEQLEDTNHIRFLRKRYSDPMTGSDFRLLHPGEVLISVTPPGVPSDPGAASTPPTSADQSSNSGTASGQSSPSSPFVSLSQMGETGPELDGGPIIGVASTSDQPSFHVFNSKDHYKDWQFAYIPALDRGALITRPYDGIPFFDKGLVSGVFFGGNTGNVSGLKGSPGFTPQSANPGP